MIRQNLLWIAVAILLIILSGFALRVNPEDVALCAAHNGWSEDRCAVELGR